MKNTNRGLERALSHQDASFFRSNGINVDIDGFFSTDKYIKIEDKIRESNGKVTKSLPNAFNSARYYCETNSRLNANFLENLTIELYGAIQAGIEVEERKQNSTIFFNPSIYMGVSTKLKQINPRIKIERIAALFNYAQEFYDKLVEKDPNFRAKNTIKKKEKIATLAARNYVGSVVVSALNGKGNEYLKDKVRFQAAISKIINEQGITDIVGRFKKHWHGNGNSENNENAYTNEIGKYCRGTVLKALSNKGIKADETILEALVYADDLIRSDKHGSREKFLDAFVLFAGFSLDRKKHGNLTYKEILERSVGDYLNSLRVQEATKKPNKQSDSYILINRYIQENIDQNGQFLSGLPQFASEIATQECKKVHDLYEVNVSENKMKSIILKSMLHVNQLHKNGDGNGQLIDAYRAYRKKLVHAN